MKKTQYYLETVPQPWSGMRQMHAAGCSLMPAKDKIKPIGSFAQAINAMQEARKTHRKAFSCPNCCKA